MNKFVEKNIDQIMAVKNVLIPLSLWQRIIVLNEPLIEMQSQAHALKLILNLKFLIGFVFSFLCFFQSCVKVIVGIGLVRHKQ